MRIQYIYHDFEDRPSGRAQRLGVRCFAKTRGWNLIFSLVAANLKDIKSAIRRCVPDGVIVESSFHSQAYPPGTFGDLPVVYFDCDVKAQDDLIFKVVYDSYDVGKKGADVLLSYRKDAYAYVGFFIPTDWDNCRRDGFSDRIKRANRPLYLFGVKSRMGEAAFKNALSRWLEGLPARVGMMAANDKVAAMALDVLKKGGHSVPEETILLGVDNDELLCSNVSPSISSIRLAMEHSGWCAAEMLDEVLSGRIAEPCTRRLGESGVVMRRSTGTCFNRNAAVVSAINYIWENVCSGIGVQDVVRRMEMSPRLAEIRFRQMTGRSIRDEIQLVRFEHVFSVLRGGIRSLSYIADCCGFGSAETFRRVFRRRTGMSVRDWVKRLPC